MQNCFQKKEKDQKPKHRTPSPSHQQQEMAHVHATILWMSQIRINQLKCFQPELQSYEHHLDPPPLLY